MDSDVYKEVCNCPCQTTKLSSFAWKKTLVWGRKLGGPLSSALRFLWPCHWINHELPGFGTFPERKVKGATKQPCRKMLKGLQNISHVDKVGMKWDNVAVSAAQVSLMSVLIEPLSLWDLTGVDDGRLRCTIVIYRIWRYLASMHLFVVSYCVWMYLNVVSSFVWMCYIDMFELRLICSVL